MEVIHQSRNGCAQQYTYSELSSFPFSSSFVSSSSFSSLSFRLFLLSLLFLTIPLQCFSFPWKVLCPYDLGRSCLRLSVQLASSALRHQSLEKMQLYLVLLLISYLLTPIGAAILGRCTVAKKLYDGGLNYFEGYSLENCEYGPFQALSPHLLDLQPLPSHPLLPASSHTTRCSTS